MKMKRLLLLAATVNILALIGCNSKQKENSQTEEAEIIPMTVTVNASRIEMEGTCVGIVHADTAKILLIRDSVSDEKVNSIYNIYTKLTLFLDSTFMADAMEDTLSLQLLAADGRCLAQLAPVDSLLADSLIAFLKQETGKSIVIDFAGQTGKDIFLQLSDAAIATLSGFSFHELDPESLADPQITKLLDEYQKWVEYVRQGVADGFGIIPQSYVHYGLPEAYDTYKKLKTKESLMTPKQKERFAKLLRIHKSLDFPE